MKLLEINCDLVSKLLTLFIKEQTEKHGFPRVVVGLSGGLDSTVAAFLAVEALGREGCIGVLLPHKISNPDSLNDAQNVAEHLGIKTRLVDISPMVEAVQASFPDISALQLGNVMARVRMIMLYQISAEEDALVMGTSNKTELLLGYGTLHGDLACAFDPLGDLYKTQVRALAKFLGVPPEIRRKVPSADLWPGQSDEAELGFTYEEADRFLVRWVDGRYSREELLKDGFDAQFGNRITERVISQQFKRTLPVIPKISSRTFGADFLYACDWMK